MTNMGMASVRKVHPLFFMTYIYQQQGGCVISL